MRPIYFIVTVSRYLFSSSLSRFISPVRRIFTLIITLSAISYMVKLSISHLRVIANLFLRLSVSKLVTLYFISPNIITTTRDSHMQLPSHGCTLYFCTSIYHHAAVLVHKHFPCFYRMTSLVFAYISKYVILISRHITISFS